MGKSISKSIIRYQTFWSEREQNTRKFCVGLTLLLCQTSEEKQLLWCLYEGKQLSIVIGMWTNSTTSLFTIVLPLLLILLWLTWLLMKFLDGVIFSSDLSHQLRFLYLSLQLNYSLYIGPTWKCNPMREVSKASGSGYKMQQQMLLPTLFGICEHLFFYVQKEVYIHKMSGSFAHNYGMCFWTLPWAPWLGHQIYGQQIWG